MQEAGFGKGLVVLRIFRCFWARRFRSAGFRSVGLPRKAHGQL